MHFRSPVVAQAGVNVGDNCWVPQGTPGPEMSIRTSIPKPLHCTLKRRRRT